MSALLPRYRQDNRSARARLEAESQLYLTCAGVIEAAHTGQGEVILISHGSGGGYDVNVISQ